MSEEKDFDPKLDKITKKLGSGVKEEMDGMDEKALRNCIVEAAKNIATALAELDGNTKYQNLKANFKAAGEGLRDVKKAQKAKSDYALILLGEKGKL